MSTRLARKYPLVPGKSASRDEAAARRRKPNGLSTTQSGVANLEGIRTLGITGAISLVLLVQSTIAQQLPREESSSDFALFAKAKVAVNAKLKDPQSARFGDMVRKPAADVNGKPTEVVCGTVTATGLFREIWRELPICLFHHGWTRISGRGKSSPRRCCPNHLSTFLQIAVSGLTRASARATDTI